MLQHARVAAVGIGRISVCLIRAYDHRPLVGVAAIVCAKHLDLSERTNGIRKSGAWQRDEVCVRDVASAAPVLRRGDGLLIEEVVGI